jgi:hypothetical protein
MRVDVEAVSPDESNERHSHFERQGDREARGCGDASDNGNAGKERFLNNLE